MTEGKHKLERKAKFQRAFESTYAEFQRRLDSLIYETLQDQDDYTPRIKQLEWDAKNYKVIGFDKINGKLLLEKIEHEEKEEQE